MAAAMDALEAELARAVSEVDARTRLEALLEGIIVDALAGNDACRALLLKRMIPERFAVDAALAADSETLVRLRMVFAGKTELDEGTDEQGAAIDAQSRSAEPEPAPEPEPAAADRDAWETL